MIKIGMWYNDKKEQVTGLDIWFNDLGCFCSGNLRIFGKIVGDYYADSVQEICEAFPHLEEKNKCLFELNKPIPGGDFPAFFNQKGAFI
jgi:hypothetical protein